MFKPEDLPVAAFEVVHIYFEGALSKAEVRPVLLHRMLSPVRVVGTDQDGDQFQADLDAFFTIKSEAEVAAAVDVVRLKHLKHKGHL